MTMNHIEKALTRRGGSTIGQALRETVATREGAAFLSGLHTGYLTAEIEHRKTVPEATPPRRVLFATPQSRSWTRSITWVLLALSVGVAACGLTAATVWHQTDARYQGMTIEAVEKMVQRGWAPIKGWDRGNYNRVTGGMDKKSHER